MARFSRVSRPGARGGCAMLACDQGSCEHLSQARARASVAPRAATPLRCAAPETAVFSRYGDSQARVSRVTQGRYHCNGAKCELAAKLTSGGRGRHVKMGSVCFQLNRNLWALRFVKPAKRSLAVPRRRTRTPPYAWGLILVCEPSSKLEINKAVAREPNAAKGAPQARAVHEQVASCQSARRKAARTHAGHAADSADRQPASFAAALPRRAGRRGLEIRDGKENAQGRAQTLPELPQVA